MTQGNHRIGVAAALLLALAGCTTGTAEQTTPNVPTIGEPPAQIRLIKRKSYCETSPADARLYVYLTFRNTGATEETIDALPIRRYDDGTTNDSVLDVVEAIVPAGETKRFYAEFDYNAREHELIECSVKLDTGSGFSEPVALRVDLPE